MRWILTEIRSAFLNRKKMDRRNFIQRVMRGSLLTGLVLVPGIFVYRKQVTGSDGCTGNYYCSRCGKLSRCTLPQAVRERETGKGNGS
jgi:hypothetical protein